MRYHDYREVVENPDIDVVSVVSPDFFHAEQAIACMKAGKHVLFSKKAGCFVVGDSGCFLKNFPYFSAEGYSVNNLTKKSCGVILQSI